MEQHSTAHLSRRLKRFHTRNDMKVLVSEKQSNPAAQVSNKREEELWYYFSDGSRKRYKLCGDCDYKTTNKLRRDKHIKLFHPFSTTALLPPTTNKKKYRFHCSQCQFKTQNKRNFKYHDACHRNMSAKHHCHLCSFSVKNRGNLTVHLDRHHREINKNSSNGQLGLQLEAEMRKHFGIKECCVILHETQLSCFKVVNPENPDLLSGKKADQVADVKLEDDGQLEVNRHSIDDLEDGEKIQLLQIRLTNMKEKARIAEENMKEISSKKLIVETKINDIAKKKGLVEYELKSQQCKFLETLLLALEMDENQRTCEVLMEVIEVEASLLDNDIQQFDNVLKTMKEEEKSLSIALEKFESFHIGVIQELEALQLELDQLLLKNSI